MRDRYEISLLVLHLLINIGQQVHQHQGSRTSPSSRNWREMSVPLQPGRRPSASGSCVVQITCARCPAPEISLQHASALVHASVHCWQLLEGEHSNQPVVSFCCLDLCVLSKQAPFNSHIARKPLQPPCKSAGLAYCQAARLHKADGCSCRQNAGRRWRACCCAMYACAGHTHTAARVMQHTKLTRSMSKDAAQLMHSP